MKCWSSTAPTIPKSPRFRPATSPPPWPSPSTSNICWWATLGSQIVNVFDLDTLQAGHADHAAVGIHRAIPSPPRPTPRWRRAAITTARSTSCSSTFRTRSGTQLPTLGVFTNLTNANTVLTASQNGSSIFIAQADGTVYLYNATSNSFTVSRKDFTSLAGPYAASAFNQYVVGNNLLDSSLVPVLQFETGTGTPSGFAFVNETGFRSNAPPPAASTTTSTTRHRRRPRPPPRPAAVRARLRASWNGST